MSSDLAPDLFRRACAQWATGIAVITLTDEEGNPRGMTANSFTSVSLSPPLVSVCVDHRAALLQHVPVGKPIAVNVLAEDQQDISSRFARKLEDRFEELAWANGRFGSPILADVLAVFECSVAQSITAGDHDILIAQVRAVAHTERRPLLYFGSSYATLA